MYRERLKIEWFFFLLFVFFYLLLVPPPLPQPPPPSRHRRRRRLAVVFSLLPNSFGIGCKLHPLKYPPVCGRAVYSRYYNIRHVYIYILYYCSYIPMYIVYTYSVIRRRFRVSTGCLRRRQVHAAAAIRVT